MQTKFEVHSPRMNHEVSDGTTDATAADRSLHRHSRTGSLQYTLLAESALSMTIEATAGSSSVFSVGRKFIFHSRPYIDISMPHM